MKERRGDDVFRAKCLLTLFGLAMTMGACRRSKEIIVFHASSLRHALFDLAQIYEREHTDTRVRLEPSGSIVAARKVAELGLHPDVVLTSDAEVIDRLLRPRYAEWNLHFATNEIVLAHRDHSPFTDQITKENWKEILTRGGLRLGRVSPETAPLGYQTLLAWSLAERSDHKRSTTGAGEDRDHPNGTGLMSRLIALVAKEHVAADETELLAFLESRAIDYAFLYRSTAEDHHLKITSLAPEENLSRRDLLALYAQTDVTFGPERTPTTVRGAPILYGLTIPVGAKDRAAAAMFVALLLSERGQLILERCGFRPLSPAPCRGAERVPLELRAMVTPAP